mgnify:FL=1
MELPRELRIERIVEDYGHFPASQLEESIQRIRKKLGGLKTGWAVDAVSAGDYRKAVDHILDYYDKSYRYCMEQKNFRQIRVIRSESADIPENAQKILEASVLQDG